MRTKFLDQRPVNHIGKQGASGLINAPLPLYSCSAVRRTSYCKLDFCNEFRVRVQWTGVAIIRLDTRDCDFSSRFFARSDTFYANLGEAVCLDTLNKSSFSYRYIYFHSTCVHQQMILESIANLTWTLDTSIEMSFTLIDFSLQIFRK